MRRRYDPRTVVVAVACGYEVVAISTGVVPTLTSLAWKARRTNAGRAAIWAGLGYLSWHLLVEDDVMGQISETLSPGSTS